VRQVIRYYHHSGVRIASALELPEWKPFRDFADHCASERADVTIALSARPLASTGMPDGTAVAQQGHIRFDVDDVGRWLVSEGQRIVIDPITIENGPELRLFTLGTAWAVLGYQRGWLMCHGSVVRPAGATKAVLLIGASGQGKSTSAAALVAAGGTLLADDLCRVESRAGGSEMVHPSARHVKLWGGAVGALGWEDRIVA
jgi:hypothetical protein